MSEPAVIHAGASLKFYRAEDGTYTSAGGYSLLYEIYNSEQKYTIAEDTIENGSWKVEVGMSTTAGYVPGHYDWSLFAVKSGEKWFLASGTLEIVEVGAARDGRSFWRKIRDALEATLLGKASRDQASLSIAGRSIGRMSPAELNEWLDKARLEVAREERAAAVADGKSPNNIARVEF